MKKTAKLFFLITLATASLSSCKRKIGCADPLALNYDPDAEQHCCCEYEATLGSNNVVVSGHLVGDETWTADNIYELAGKVIVDPGVTLTIEAGTVIKGRPGNGTLASALIVARGGTLMANGTAIQPIIFTTTYDQIQSGSILSPNLDETINGQWGGLVVLGSAPISAEQGDTETQIEGIPASETYGLYGGNDPADNSGVITYISVRHAGALIGEGNELNGITLGGVGNGTTINHVEVIGNLDDGIEFFGGTVNVEHALVAYQGDDGIDIDMNYSGTVDNFVVMHGGLTDEALEIDGPEGSTHTTGLFTLTNGSIWTSDGVGSGADLKSKAQGTITNTYWYNYPSKMIKIRASYSDTASCTLKTDAYTHLTAPSPTLTIDNSNEFVGSITVQDAIDVYTKSMETSTCTDQIELTAEATVGASVVSTATVGADLTEFNLWSWASAAGKLQH